MCSKSEQKFNVWPKFGFQICTQQERVSESVTDKHSQWSGPIKIEKWSWRPGKELGCFGSGCCSSASSAAVTSENIIFQSLAQSNIIWLDGKLYEIMSPKVCNNLCCIRLMLCKSQKGILFKSCKWGNILITQSGQMQIQKCIQTWWHHRCLLCPL